MPVVISDFEVIVEPPAAQADVTEAAVESETVVLTPPELEMLLERQSERDARVRAH
jgi:hypothetical protein